MPYIKRETFAGKTVRVQKHYSARIGTPGIKRGPNQSKSSEQVKKQNERNAKKNLTDLLCENFGKNDMHIVLTYARQYAPTPEESKKDLDKFLRKARKVYQKAGKELKYIAVTEYKNKRIHHHLIVNAIDAGALQQVWEYGKLRPTYLDETGDYKQLAEYLIKETAKTYAMDDAPQKKRYTCSRNLKRPQVRVRKQSPKTWRPTPRIPKGYMLIPDSLYNGFDLYGFPVQEYRLLKLGG